MTTPAGSVRPLAVVTGASSGIGAVFAGRLAARGHDLLLAARRKDRLEALAAELERRFGVAAEAFPADLADDGGLRRLEDRVAAAANLAFLVNNAGFGTKGLFCEADPAAQDRMHRLHVLATARLTRAALPGMVARKTGSVVNVSSAAAFAQNPGNTCYCATKAWMNSFTEGLYLELRSTGSPVRVQALCPGFTLTEFHDVLGVDRKVIPAGWWMTAEAVVDASLRGLEGGKWLVVPGWRYRLYAALMSVLPGKLRHVLSVSAAGRARRARARTPGSPDRGTESR